MCVEHASIFASRSVGACVGVIEQFERRPVDKELCLRSLLDHLSIVCDFVWFHSLLNSVGRGSLIWILISFIDGHGIEFVLWRCKD